MPKKHRRTFTFNGKTIDRVFDSKSSANEWYSMMKRKAERVKAGLPMAMDDLPIRIAAAKWISLRERTTDYWMQDNAKMIVMVPEFGEKTVQGATKGDCESVLHGVRKKLSLTGATFNRYRACLHTFFEFTLDEGYRENNPVGRIDKMPEMERGAHIADESVNAYVIRLREEAPVFFAFLVFAMNTGVRSGEALALTWEDFRPDLGCIEIKKRYQRQLGRVKEGTKGGAGRKVPLNKFAIAALVQFRAIAKHSEPEDLIFHREDGTHIDTRLLQDVHRKVARAVGLADKVRLYDITRHKFASAVAAKFGLRAAQEMLGHSTSTITERYAHTDQEALVSKISAGIVVGNDTSATSEKDGNNMGSTQDYSHTTHSDDKK